MFIFLDNFLGELNFVTTIDHVSVIGKKDAEKELVPIGKLKDFLMWREKEFLSRAQKHGPHTQQLVAHILTSRPVPEQSYRSCMGILRLGDKYGSLRLEAAALRALHSELSAYKSVAAILKNGLDTLPVPTTSPEKPPLVHENLRGADYYRQNNAADIQASTPDQKENSHA